MALVVQMMVTDMNNAFVMVNSRGVGVRDERMSVADGTAVFRATISFVLIAYSQAPSFEWWLQLRAASA